MKYEAQKVNMNSNKARMVTSYFPRAQVRVVSSCTGTQKKET